MRPRTKKFGKRFLSLFLSLAICATLLPTVALAEDAELIKFKNMHMTVRGTAQRLQTMTIPRRTTISNTILHLH